MRSTEDRNESRQIRVFTGRGAWIGDLWRPARELSTVEREARTAAWLRQNGYSVPEDYLEVLALCDSASELRFAIPIILLPDWYKSGEASFSNGKYELHFQVPFQQYRLDFLLTGASLPYSCNIEVDGPSHRTPDAWRKDRNRDRAVQMARIGVYRVASDRVFEEGMRFRSAFGLESLSVNANSADIVPASTIKRVWPRVPEAFSMIDQPPEIRPALVAAWLKSRGVLLTDEQAKFLSHCDRGAEVLFVYPLIARPGWHPIGERAFTDGASLITLQEPIDAHRVDVILEQPAVTPGDNDVFIMADICVPQYSQLDVRSETRCFLDLVSAGYELQLIELHEFREVSSRWGRWIDWVKMRANELR